MGAGAQPAAEHRYQDAACAQRRDQISGRQAGAVELEEHQIGVRRLHPHAGDLRQALRETSRTGMILGEPRDIVVEGIEAGGGADTGLAHGAAEPLFPAPDLVDESL